MTQVNELIRDKLQEYSPEVRQLALEVVKAASEMSAQALQEYVETLLRKAIRAKGESL